MMEKSGKPYSRALAELVRPVLAESVKAQGFAAADILGRWPAIVGERLAERTMPVRLVWPPRPKEALPDAPPIPATLVLKVESAFALEVEMQAALIVERVNAVFGWRCVDKLRLKQGPVERIERIERRAAPTLEHQEAKALRERLAGIGDEGLRSALERLGTAVLGRRH